MKIFRSLFFFTSLATSWVSAQGDLGSFGKVFEFKRSGQPYYLQISSTQVANVVADVSDPAARDLDYQIYPEAALVGIVEPITLRTQYRNGLPPGGLAGIEDFFTMGAGAFAAYYNTELNVPLTLDSVIIDPPGTIPTAAFPSLIFYPVGADRDASQRHVLRKDYVVKLKPGFSAADFQGRQGIVTMQPIYPAQQIFICEGEHSYEALQRIYSVAQDPAVETVEPLFIRELFKRVVPSDPFYPFVPSNIGYQWYLNNTGQNQATAGVDIRLEEALDVQNPDGSGVSGAASPIMIVDDGVFFDHPELATFGLLGLSRDFNSVGGTGASVNPADTHGTAMAGIISAERNAIGISGVTQAPFASLRLLGAAIDDTAIFSALDYDDGDGSTGFRGVKGVSLNGWGPSDASTELVNPSILVKAAIEKESAAISDPAQTGTVYVWAAGNGAENGDNSNYDGYANLPETIAVGAVTDQGRKAFYSENGANLVVSGLSSGGSQSILTTSADGSGPDGLRNDFGGTSAAAATVAGVVSLMMDANRDLGWRDVQEILMETATKNDPNGGDWIENGAGINFNHSYGAGLVNAKEAVEAARDRGTDILDDRDAPLTLNQTVTANIPDGSGNSYLLNFDLSQMTNRRVEHVELKVKIAAERRADLDIVLVSPSGTQSVLARSHLDSDEVGIPNWTFSSVRNWGEGSAGIWVLRISDRISGNPALLNNAQLIVHGVDDASAPVSQSPLLVSDQVINAIQGVPLTYLFETLGSTNISVDQLPAGLSLNGNTIGGAATSPGLFESKVTLTGPMGVQIYPLTFIISPVALSLGDGVEQNGRATTSSGDAPWDYEFGDTFSGGDAVASAANLPGDSSSGFGFNNLASDERVVVSHWKVSSQDGADRLYLHDGGDTPQQWYAFIDGRRLDYSPIAVRLPSGKNNINWTFTRDGDDVGPDGLPQDAGTSQGFVDNVKFFDSKSFDDDLKFAANVIHPDPDFNFTQIGKTLFLPVDDPSASGGRAIRSSAIGDGQTVALAAWIDGPAQVSFKFRTDVELGDGMEYMVGGVVRNGVIDAPVVGTGVQGWTDVEDELPPGRHYVVIRYRKDFSGESLGADAVWLDDIVITELASFPAWMSNSNLPSSNGNPDPDGNGYSYEMEYAFGGIPGELVTPQYAPQLRSAFGSDWVEFGVDISKSDVTYEAQESTNLDSWQVTTAAVFDRQEGNYKVYRIPIANDPAVPAKFYRVKIEVAP